jgi:hypothetical protein
MSEDLFQELLRLMPCFYDIQVSAARNITRLSAAVFKRARERTGTGKQWPFVAVKENQYILKWGHIRERRALAIETASDAMKQILMKVERTSHLMRVWNMPMRDRIALEATPFPTVAEDENEMSDPENGERSLIKHELTQRQKERILPFMIDIPIHEVTRILNISHHSLQMMRQNIGLEVWPLESIRRRMYRLSPDDVVQLRNQAIATLLETSEELSILKSTQACVDAKNEVNVICRQAKRARLARQSVQLTEQAETVSQLWVAPEVTTAEPQQQQVEEEGLFTDPVENNNMDDDFKEWFQSMLGEEGETEEQLEDQRFWREGCAELSPDERAYWDSLLDFSPDHLATGQAP